MTASAPTAAPAYRPVLLLACDLPTITVSPSIVTYPSTAPSPRHEYSAVLTCSSFSILIEDIHVSELPVVVVVAVQSRISQMDSVMADDRRNCKCFGHFHHSRIDCHSISGELHIVQLEPKMHALYQGDS